LSLKFDGQREADVRERDLSKSLTLRIPSS
jgi:hypothetical protein